LPRTGGNGENQEGEKKKIKRDGGEKEENQGITLLS
jgi:hypothetical protein